MAEQVSEGVLVDAAEFDGLANKVLKSCLIDIKRLRNIRNLLVDTIVLKLFVTVAYLQFTPTTTLLQFFVDKRLEVLSFVHQIYATR